jgi:hypothetical protein
MSRFINGGLVGKNTASSPKNINRRKWTFDDKSLYDSYNSWPSTDIVTNGLQVYFDTTRPASYGGQNLFRVSGNPTNTSYWSYGNLTISTAPTIAPPSETLYPLYSRSVYKMSEQAVNDQHLLFQSLGGTTTLGNIETISGYFKAAERNFVALTMHGEGYPYFDLVNGIAYSGGGSNIAVSIRPAGNGWWYCSATFARTNVTRSYYLVTFNGTSHVYQGVAGSGVYMYEAQVRYNSQSTEGFVGNNSISEFTYSPSIWYDISGNATNITATNTTVTSDFGPPGWRFDGNETRYMQTSTGISIGNNWSYEFVLYNNNDSATIPLMTGFHLNDGRETINLDISGQNIIYAGSDFANWPQVTTPRPTNQYKFMQINVTCSNGLLNFWMSTKEDGPLYRLVTNFQGNTGQSQASARFYMGRYSNFNGYSLDGGIYSFKFYNRTLSESEIIQNFNATRGFFEL